MLRRAGEFVENKPSIATLSTRIVVHDYVQLLDFILFEYKI